LRALRAIRFQYVCVVLQCEHVSLLLQGPLQFQVGSRSCRGSA
jgi:hypothetical protein